MIYSEDFDPTIGRSIRKLIISFYQINSLQESLGVFHEMVVVVVVLFSSDCTLCFSATVMFVLFV